MTLISFAQNFEDIILWRALNDISSGRYLDIGAQDPVRDSVSKFFYDRSWRGIHAEPSAYYAQLIRDARPDETVIEALVSDGEEDADFFEVTGTGLSTGVASVANTHRSSGYEVERVSVPTESLARILDRFEGEAIHWMKIDVEGMEPNVLRSWGDNPARPWLLSIESTAPNSQEPAHEGWIDLVLSRGYVEVYFDGLSRYFLHEDQLDRRDAFAVPPNVFDGFAITDTHFASGLLNGQHDRVLADLRTQIDDKATQVAALVASQEEMAGQVGRARSEVQLADARLVNANAQISSQRADFLAQLTAARGEVQSLAEEKAGLNATLAQQAEQLVAEKALFDRALGELRENGRRRDAEREAAHDHQTALLRDQLAASAARADGIARERADLSDRLVATLERHEAVVGEHVAHVAGLTGQLSEAAVQHASLWRELEAVRQQVAQRSAQLVAVQGSLAALRAARWSRLGSFLGLVPRIADAAEFSGLGGALVHDQTLGSRIVMHNLPGRTDDWHPTSLSELLDIHDEPFVRMAYRLVLGREGDVDGVTHYVEALRGGDSKMRILRSLRRSDEGGQFTPGLEGLDGAIRRYTWVNRRFVGWFASCFVQAERERVVERQIRKVQNQVGRMSYEQMYVMGEVQRLAVAQVSAGTSGDAPGASYGAAPVFASTSPSVLAARNPLAQFFERAVWSGR